MAHHSQYHSINAFCGSAGAEEMRHLQSLVSQLTDEELKDLVERVGIRFAVSKSNLSRDDYESVIDESDREDFYREYKIIATSRRKKSFTKSGIF